MNDTLTEIRVLIAHGEVRVSLHGYDELAADDIFLSDVMGGVTNAVVIEDYPDAAKGPCVLVLQRNGENSPIHVVWGIPKGQSTPAVLVTAYRPDPRRWSGDFMKRKNT